MRIFTLEIKKILKTRVTWILLLTALVLSVLMAYLPVTFEGVSYQAENGERVQLNGLAAIPLCKRRGSLPVRGCDNRKDTNGGRRISGSAAGIRR